MPTRIATPLLAVLIASCGGKTPAAECGSGQVDVDGICRQLCIDICPLGQTCEDGICVACESDPCEPIDDGDSDGDCTFDSDCINYPGDGACFTATCANHSCSYEAKTVGTVCSATTCTDGTVTFATTCDADGLCAAPTPSSASCGASGCDPEASPCTGVDDCCLDAVDPTPGILVSSTNITNASPFTAPTFTVTLATQPTDAVSMSLSSSHPGKATASPDTLQFTTSNWATPQTVTITPQSDGVLDIDNQVTIVLGATVSGDSAYSGIDPPDVTVTNIDADKIERISVGPGGAWGNGGSSGTSISSDGRYVAFLSSASNLVSGDNNSAADIFLRDRLNGTTTRVSLSSTGGELTPNFWGTGAFALSGNGQCLVFSSDANGIVAGDSNDSLDLFLRVLPDGPNEQVNVDSAEQPGDDSGNLFFDPQVSSDCSYVAFSSSGTNLVASDTNGASDMFVRNRAAGTTERVSISTGGTQGNGGSVFGLSISADGRYVAFTSAATNLVADDTNATNDVFVRDRLSSTTTRISLSSAGDQGNGSSSLGLRIAGDGGHVAFMSAATNLVADDTNGKNDIFLRNLGASTTSIVTISTAGAAHDGDVYVPKLDASGRYVVFTSSATGLVASDTNAAVDIFLRDTQAGTTVRVNVAADGSEANAASNDPSISSNGKLIVFSSSASNLMADDTNGASDVFIVRRP